MLTWAYAYISKHSVSYVPALFALAMFCDVAVFAILGIAVQGAKVCH